MDIKEYFSKMKNIEEKLLNYLNQADNVEVNYENFNKIIDDENIRTNQYDFKIILYLINAISMHHHRLQSFIYKIEQILQIFKDEIQQYFSNEEVFKIFKSNKRILLFLIKEKILTIDQSIYKDIVSNKYKMMYYPEYFLFEIKSFKEEDLKNKEMQNPNDKINEIIIDDFEKFDEKRKKGENDGYLYQIIQNDLIEEFITYVNKECYSLNSFVEDSIFETNSFLLKQRQITLIEYAAFYGSAQIFKYLYKNNAEMTSDLWFYAIHGYDEEIIHILEENIGRTNDKECTIESIKCHHHYITNYFIENFTKNEECSYNYDILSYYFKYYNFVFIDIEKIMTDNLFFLACKYDYYKIAEFMLSTKKMDLNNQIICFLFS